MFVLIIEAFVVLVLFDVVSWFGFRKTYELVRKWPVLFASKRKDIDERICRAVDEACVWYYKRVLCLQRSAVTTCLLRLHGVEACLVIGFRPVPLESHAWVEVGGLVINDRPQYQKFFQVLDRL